MTSYSESELLESLSELYAERDRLRLSLEEVDREVIAAEQDLRGLREEALESFLSDKLSPINVGFTLYEEEDELLVGIFPEAGGEAEYESLVASLNWDDLSALPVIYLLQALGEGMPWESEGGYL